MNDRTHPDSGPVTPGEAGFTAADMATAAAQGFRNGVASVVAENTNTERDYPPLPEPAATGLGDEYEAFDRNGRPMGKAYETIEYFKADQMRAYVDADRKARASLSLPAAGQEPVAYLHDDGYWTPAKTEEGRKLNDRLHFAGSEKIGVHLAAPQPAVAAGWMPIETAPKDGTPIIGYCVHSDDTYYEEAGNRLTNYGARAEGLSHVEDGAHVLVWDDVYECSDGWEMPSVTIPAWWTLAHDAEVTANPTHWMHIPPAPSTEGEKK